MVDLNKLRLVGGPLAEVSLFTVCLFNCEFLLLVRTHNY